MDKKRVLEKKINLLLDMFPVVAIIGPRQCEQIGVRVILKEKLYLLKKKHKIRPLSAEPDIAHVIWPRL